MITRKPNTFIQFVRKVLGDEDGKVFNDDELGGIISKHTDIVPTTANITFYSKKASLCPCSGCPVVDLTLSANYDANGVYVVDEWAGTVYFDSDDPDNTGTDPVDGAYVTVKYYSVCLIDLMVELFTIWASSTAKLTTYQSLSGYAMDTTKLSEALSRQAYLWAAKSECC